MGGQAKIVKAGENQLRNSVVENPLTINHGLLFGVKGGGVIFKVNNQGVRLGAFIQNFGFAFINTFATGFHGRQLSFQIDGRIGITGCDKVHSITQKKTGDN